MKLLLVSVLYSIFAVAFGAMNRGVKTEPTYLSEAEASKYCNSLYPVTEDPRQTINRRVINAETITEASTFNDVEYCHLNCLLEKVGFYGPDGSMRVKSIVKHILNILPELKPNRLNLMIALSHIDRSSKDIEDKCSKALLTYYRFVEQIMYSTLSADLNANPAIKERVTEAALNGNSWPTELKNSVQKSFANVEIFFDKTAEASGSTARARGTASRASMSCN